MSEKTAEQLHKEDLERIAKYRPLDDDFLRVLFKDNIPLTELVIRIILGRADLKVEHQETQYDTKMISGARSLTFDIYATDENGEKHNIEIQRADKGAGAKRARYHSSAMDIENLRAGEDFSLLPATYVIFITESDVRGEGKAIYHFKWRDDSGNPLGDGANIIYVNAAYDKEGDTSDIAKLMHDFRCSEAENMYFGLLADRTRYFKETEEGVNYMCKLNEDMRNAAKHAKAVEIAVNLIKEGLGTIEKIADITGLSIDEIKELAEKNKPATA